MNTIMNLVIVTSLSSQSLVQVKVNFFAALLRRKMSIGEREFFSYDFHLIFSFPHQHGLTDL